MKHLCKRRHDTIENLAFEFDVSTRTIRRDIDTLSISEPIYTQTGRYGGVYVMDGYYIGQLYMSDEEINVLKKLHSSKVIQNLLKNDELKTLEHIIDDYSKPKKQKGEKYER